MIGRPRPPATRRIVAALCVAATVAGLVGSCSRLPGADDGSYSMTAHFERAVSVYAGSRVKVMGLDAGTITDVEPEGDTVRVEIDIDDDVPIPDDVRAAVVPLSLIGERNVVLYPAWTEGMGRAGDGDVIPVERTEIPVEPDEALQAFTDLARGLDPDEVSRLVSEGAEALDGRGDLLNDALAEVGDLTGLLAREDDGFVRVARNMNRLARTLNTREDQLGSVLDSFASATGVLRDERAQIEELVAALGVLATEGNSLLAAHESHLPEDLAQLSRVSRSAEANTAAIAQLVRALAANNEGLVGAHDKELDVLRQRINLTPITAEVLRPFFEALGVDVGDVPCVPQPGVKCP